MLGFAPRQLVDWPDLDLNHAGLAVWPEEGLYFSDPLETMGMPTGPHCLDGLGGPCGHGHADLRVAAGTNASEQPDGAGVYRREFRRCYDRGRPIGGCAAIVNDTDAPVTIEGAWLRQRYRFEMTFAGGEVQSGGRLNIHGTPLLAGTTMIAPDDAALLSQ